LRILEDVKILEALTHDKHCSNDPAVYFGDLETFERRVEKVGDWIFHPETGFGLCREMRRPVCQP
jgi:hypothetical protein